jgi:exopolysaccharide biosynthesis protein
MGKQFIKIISILIAIMIAFSLTACQTVTVSGNSKTTASEASVIDNTTDSGSTDSAPTPSPKPSEKPQASSKPSPSPSKASAQSKDTQYFTSGKEIVSAEVDKGQWLYRSSTVYVKVERIFNKQNVQTYYVADVRIKPSETERSGFSTPSKPGYSNGKVYQVARAYQAVIAINGDFMQYVEPKNKGIIIRNGKIYLDKSNEDTLAFMPDGSLKIYKPKETTAKELLAAGVKETFSFGPTLVNGGQMADNLDKARLKPRNPRTAVGMVEPYHFILIVVDGRQKGYSVGMTYQELAQVFLDHHCMVAYNLDGGQSATMSFMGTDINKYGGSTTGQRKVPDTLMFGKSDQVPKS